MQRIGALLGAVFGDIVDIQVAVVDRADHQAGERVAAGDAWQPGGSGCEVHRTGLVTVLAEDLLQMAEFAAELDGVRAMYPSNQLIADMRGPRGLVQGAGATRIPPARKL